MATTVMSSLVLKPSPVIVRSQAKALPSLARSSSSFKVQASGGKKIKTSTPYGTGGGMDLPNGLDASGRKQKGKGVYQFVDKYGANVDGYSPIYSPEEWSPSGDVYVGGTTGLLIWAVTLAGLLLGGALLVYNTSALSQ
ncbi:photosystem II 10 kDa polypeptide, chloroplastic-like [Typha latifolia]|uniref:photosystem II 10 kDa polypeptide, chloroplastic-like n=1 Tax=Typha latifolia TaxID=4733 RepID=UPI003C3065E8